MTVLVTGSSGHLGEALMRRLRSEGRPARGIDIKASPFTDCVGSICDRAFVRQCMTGVDAVFHTAALHKPHVATHRDQDFVDTNISGTLITLEEAVRSGVSAFVFTSTTSAFGAALSPPPDAPAVWITEDVKFVAKNIYGVTKAAAESFCELFSRREGLPVIVLRVSRFFPEADDNAGVRAQFNTANTQANEFLYRRIDLDDAAAAHFIAIERAKELCFRVYIISATTPFRPEDLSELRASAPDVVRRLFPDCDTVYEKYGWKLFKQIDRVYANDLARKELSWNPKCDFRHVLDCLREDKDFRSALGRQIGSKGYHDRVFDEGPYPVVEPR
jgi:UDP-glucose 4-epimerase